MKTIHTTKDNKTIHIVSMTDAHLLNQISVLIRKLKDANTIIINGHNISKVEMMMSGIKINMSSYESIIENFRDTIAPYILEALHRNLDLSFYIKEIQEISGRSSAIQNTASYQIGYKSEIEDDDDEYDTDY